MPIRTRESSLTFEELHDLLVGHKAYLRRLEVATHNLVVSANFTKTKQFLQRRSHRGISSKLALTVGLKVLNQAATQMEPNVMDVAPTTLGDLTTPISVTNPNVKFVTNWATLQSLVLNSIHRMPPSIVLQPLLARIKIDYLIWLLLIISRVIFPTYPFTPNMMELMK